MRCLKKWDAVVIIISLNMRIKKDVFLYKTTSNKVASRIYIDLLPCHNNNNELKIECPSHSIPEKITDKLYDLIVLGLVEKI